MYLSVNIYIDFNDGISSYPASMFISVEDVKNKESEQISILYDYIKKEEVINSDNSDSSYIKDTELPTSRGTIYVDDNADPSWYDRHE